MASPEVSEILSQHKTHFVRSVMNPDVMSLGEPMFEFCATDVGRLSRVPLFKRG